MSSGRLPTTISSVFRHRILLRFFSTIPEEPFGTAPPAPVNEEHLLRVCSLLFRQRAGPFPRLQSNLQKTDFHLSHDFFLHVCHKFPLAWRPVYLFYKFTLTRLDFSHTPFSFNAILDVLGKAQKIGLFCDILSDSLRRRFVTTRTIWIAMRTFAEASSVQKAVDFFALLNDHGYDSGIETLNRAVVGLCKSKHAIQARNVVFKLRRSIKPDGFTYNQLICGFCSIGDMIEASKIWNLMVKEGFDPDIPTYNKMIEAFFKRNQIDDALELFQAMRVERLDEIGLPTYNVVVDWLCNKGRTYEAHHVLDEMRQRGIQPDDKTLASLLYGLVCKRRIREAYSITEKIKNPTMNIFHALIKAFVRTRKPSEATDVFREMIRRGCEPTKHTYIMLLQAHFGRWGQRRPDAEVDFNSVFVGGLVKAEKFLRVNEYAERALSGDADVPRFDYSLFLECYSNEEGVVMFEEVGKRFREAGMVDLADIFTRYGLKMATRERRLDRPGVQNVSSSSGHSASDMKRETIHDTTQIGKLDESISGQCD